MKALLDLDLKHQLDEYRAMYETSDFIKDDPVCFIHKFNNKADIEISGFIASSFAYGKRSVFITKLNHIFDLMNNSPLDYIKSGDFSNIKNCDYRFSKDIDLIQILKILNMLYNDGETLQSLFEYSYNKGKNCPRSSNKPVQGCETGLGVWQMFQGVVDYCYSKVDLPVTKGFYHLLPNPAKKSALKRMNMMLRWFVRKSVVDKGIWNFIQPCDLLIPLDVHVAKISRKLGLLTRNDNGYDSVIEITQKLKQFDFADPIKYDFALFGYGVNNAV